VAKTLHENAGIGTENEAAHGDIARYSVALECRQFGGFDSLVVYSPPEALPFGVIVGTLLALRAGDLQSSRVRSKPTYPL